jgi:hypothetical protein
MLFSLSGNTCALPGCEEQLFKRGWEGIKAEVCHIAGEKEGAARWDPNMTDSERRDFTNLIVLCPTSHTVIDQLGTCQAK